jgi:steroid delta-isomerase-like uncharacterized protein
MSEQNKASDRRFYDEGLNKHSTAIVDELCTASVTVHSPIGTTHGAAEYKQFLTGYFTAFPDLHFTLHEQLAEGNTTVTHWTATGDHKGPLGPIPATGKHAQNSGVTINHWVNGKVQEAWIFFDNLALMQQLGVIPKMG